MEHKLDEDISAAALLENILDQACLDDGMTLEELHQSKIIAQIEACLVVQGRSIKDIYSEWERKTPVDIISEYFYLLEKDKGDWAKGSTRARIHNKQPPDC